MSAVLLATACHDLLDLQGWFQALTLQLTAMCLASYYIATCG